MSKKNFLIIGGTTLIFVIIIILLLLLSGNKKNWTEDILKAQSYQMIMKDCNDREKELDKETLKTISNKWNTLSNNGPWTGDNNNCYTTITISYENNGIINEKEIVVLDNNSLILIQNNNSTYYTNANDIITYLNSLFIS